VHSGSGSAVLCGGSAARGKAPGGLSRGRVRARRGGPPRVPRSAVIIPTSPARAPPTHQHRPDPHRHNPQVGVMGFAPGVMHVEEVSVAVVHQGARVPAYPSRMPPASMSAAERPSVCIAGQVLGGGHVHVGQATGGARPGVSSAWSTPGGAQQLADQRQEWCPRSDGRLGPGHARRTPVETSHPERGTHQHRGAAHRPGSARTAAPLPGPTPWASTAPGRVRPRARART